MKKKNYVLLLGVLLLFISYFIGQNVVLPLRMDNTASTEGNMFTAEKDGSVSGEEEFQINCFEYYLQLGKIGYQSTEDNPWGETVSLIAPSEELPEAILLTSGSGVEVPVELKNSPVVEIKVGIHPWVAEYSDGAILEVHFIEEGKTESGYTKEYEIKDEQLMDITVDLSAFAGERGIVVVKCSSGTGGDVAGDWLMITEMNIYDADYVMIQAHR